jgi:hypothetical protein
VMALHGINLPHNTLGVPRGYDYDWSKPSYPRKPELWKTAKTFLADALDNSVTKLPEVDVTMRKVDEEAVHYNIWDATTSKSAVLYKVFGKIQEWMEWEDGDQKTKFLPLGLMVRGAS